FGGHAGSLELPRVIKRVEANGRHDCDGSGPQAMSPSLRTPERPQNGMSSSKSSTFFLPPPLPPLAAAPAVSRRAGAPPPLEPNSTSPPLPESRPPPINCIRSPTTSVEYFSTPSLSVYLRVCSRPSMYTERPFFRYSPATSAWR